jgi:glycosyltransferase involved in cell wall biosynthesis
MRGLIDAGAEIDVFPIYPIDPAQWKYVPNILDETILPRNRVHHVSISDSFEATTKFLTWGERLRLLQDIVAITGSAVRYGIQPVAKTGYVLFKALSWAKHYGDQFDHVLAYWGNYAGTCAFLFHRIIRRAIPFSVFLHAGTDLYRTPVFMKEKLRYADRVITCSEFNDRFIRDKFSDIAESVVDKIHVHHHGLDLSEFAFESNGRSSSRIVAVGRIEKEKGFDYLMKAVSRLKELGVDLETEIVGDGSCADYLRTLCNELGIVDRVTFRGWLTPDETRLAMRRATVLVHPSPDLGDGVPNVIKECMALGTPVIGTKVAGIPELLENGKHGCLVPAKDIDALAVAIKKVLENRQLQTEYACSARTYAERRFDLWRNGEELLDVLRSARRRRDTGYSRRSLCQE